MSDSQGPGPFPGMSFPPPPPPPGAGATRTGPAWEGNGAFVEKFIATARTLLTDPKGFFATLSLSGGLQNPIVYLAIGSAIAGVASTLYSFVTPRAAVGGASMIVLYPILSIVGSFIGAGIFHVLLSMLGGAKQPFEATYRVVAYVAGTTTMFAIVPFCGSIIGALYGLYLYVTGLASVHECDTSKAAIAVLAPAVLCCVVIAIFWAAIAAMIGIAAVGAAN